MSDLNTESTLKVVVVETSQKNKNERRSMKMNFVMCFELNINWINKRDNNTTHHIGFHI